MLGACRYDDGTTPEPQRLGKSIWDTAYPDLKRLNEVLDLVASYKYYLSLDNEDLDENYKRSKLNNPQEIVITDNRHILIYGTDYGTTYTITIEMYNERWEVTRSGGNGFNLTIRAIGNDIYAADIAYIYNKESAGYGSIEGHLAYNEGEPEISIQGELVMVDKEESRTHPLTITTQITEDATFDRINDIESGFMTITAEDELYGTKDTIKAWIMMNNELQSVVIEYLGTREGHYI